MIMLQYPPTSRSHPHKQVGTFRTSFERDFICNKLRLIHSLINLSILNSSSKICFINRVLWWGCGGMVGTSEPAGERGGGE